MKSSKEKEFEEKGPEIFSAEPKGRYTV